MYTHMVVAVEQCSVPDTQHNTKVSGTPAASGDMLSAVLLTNGKKKFWLFRGNTLGVYR